MITVPITAIIAAYDRQDATRETIRRLQACDPAPAEILVHLDNGADFPLPPGVRVIRSERNVGPGGGRNKLVQEAAHEWVASFDDDSYPQDSDYFARLAETISLHPEAGVIAAEIRHRNPAADAPTFDRDMRVAAFVGCGCAYHRETFLRTRGYVPLPVAYGMEEVDLALQLHALGMKIIESPGLKIYHDTDLGHHDSPKITAGSIMNQALLVWARYPASEWLRGVAQWLNKARDNVKRGRFRGTVQGVLGTPRHLWRYRALRSPIPAESLRSWWHLRESPTPEPTEVSVSRS